MSSDKGAGKDAGGRIRPTDKLIKRPVVQAIMGDMSTSSLYEDPELMALRIAVGPHTVRWIEREIYETRARRVARSEERADAIRAQVEEQRERRRARQRQALAAARSQHTA